MCVCNVEINFFLLATAMTLIDESGMEPSGETDEVPSITLHPNPAVVTEILPPASGRVVLSVVHVAAPKFYVVHRSTVFTRV